MKPRAKESVCQGTVIVPGRFQRDAATVWKAMQKAQQPIKISRCIRYAESMSLATWRFNQYRILVTSNVDRYQVE